MKKKTLDSEGESNPLTGSVDVLTTDLQKTFELPARTEALFDPRGVEPPPGGGCGFSPHRVSTSFVTSRRSNFKNVRFHTFSAFEKHTIHGQIPKSAREASDGGARRGFLFVLEQVWQQDRNVVQSS